MVSDVLIVGAGVVGSAVAMSLAHKGVTGIQVIDFDLEGSLSSSELNAGGVRATFNQPLNIEFSKKTIYYLAEHADEVGYRADGYLWLHEPMAFQKALKARKEWEARQWPTEVWDLDELQRRIPFLDKTENLGGAIFSPKDGLVNPNLVKKHFRDEARKRGVVFTDRTAIAEVLSTNPFQIRVEHHEEQLESEQQVEWFSGRSQLKRIESSILRPKIVINCAGAWAGHVAQILGYRSPVFAVRRQICLFDSHDFDFSPYGMIVDSSGVYFHPEATHLLAGFANHNEPRGVNYAYDGESFFMETIWPPLFDRSTKLERLKHLMGWAGQYEVSPDESAVLGAVDGKEGMFEAHSFSGHGLMHSYAAGEALAELIVTGKYQTLDASPFSGARFETGALLRETAVI